MSLLLAALAFLIGGVAGPSLHSHWAASGPAAAVSVPESDSGIPLPDGERGCFVCQLLGAPGLPAIAARLPELSVPLAAASPPLLESASHRESASSRARAPPVLHPH